MTGSFGVASRWAATRPIPVIRSLICIPQEQTFHILGIDRGGNGKP